MVENPRVNAGDTRDKSSIPGSGRCPGGGNDNPLCILGWKTPWSLVGYSPWDYKELDMTEHVSHSSLASYLLPLANPTGSQRTK